MEDRFLIRVVRVVLGQVKRCGGHLGLVLEPVQSLENLQMKIMLV